MAALPEDESTRLLLGERVTAVDVNLDNGRGVVRLDHGTNRETW